MRGIKPFKVSFLTRPFQWGPSYQLGISAFTYSRLTGAPTFYPDAEMWMEIPPVLGKDLVLDEGIPKSRAEFLAMGTCHQPGGVPGPLRSVKVKVGALEKTIHVIGDRRWRRGVPTEPRPFTEMPLTWDYAFGGAGFANNPRGKGAAELEGEDGEKYVPLPNLERPGDLIDSPRDRPEPTTFGVIDFTWPQRFSRVGTYDKKWMDTRFPGFAEDMQWQMWNLGASDQQQAEPFRGDEELLCENMHPTEPRLTGRLPGLRCRAFVSQRRGREHAFQEVPLRLTTVWLLPSIDRVVTIFQGAHPVLEDDGSDVECLMVAGERLDQTRPLSHYRNVYDKRSGEDRALELLNDEDLFPKEWCGMSPEVGAQLEATTPENLPMKRQIAAMKAEIEIARERIAAEGLDPDLHGPKQVDEEDVQLPSLDKLSQFIVEKREEAQKALAQAAEHQAGVRAKGKAFYESAGLDWAEIEAERTRTPRGPPTYTADGDRAEIQALADRARASGQPVDELETMLADEKLHAQRIERQVQEREMYRRLAHTQDPAWALEGEASAGRKQEVERAVRAGEALAGWDLTGADLSGMDLAEVDFTGAFLEAVDFRGASMKGAKLDGAVLAHAKLDTADLTGARLGGANLGGASARGACLAGVDLRDAQLSKADLRSADLSGANLEKISLTGGSFEGARLRGANLGGARLLEIDFTNVDLTGAQLPQSMLYRMKLDGLDFGGANLFEATFVGCTAEGARFVNADLRGFRTVEGCLLRNCDFKGANLGNANLRGIDMQRSDLSGARLDGADLSEAKLEEARLYRIVARQSMWTRARLRNAFLVSADLFEALLDKADLRGADLRGANLYGANFALIRADAKTNVTDAIQDHVRVLPLRPPSEVDHDAG